MNAHRRHGSRGRKIDHPMTSFGKFCQWREKGLKVIPSFPHSLSGSSLLLLHPSLLFFSFLFFFSLFLPVASSFVSPVSSMVAGDICTWWYHLFFLVFYFVSYFLCGGFPFGRAVFLCEATRVFQPCCIIAGWAGSPWPGSNPTQKKTIIVYNVFLRWPFSFWA